MSAPDFRLRDSGSIWLLFPVSDAAKAWIEENIPDDAQWLGKGLAIEARFVDNILGGLAGAGLAVDML